MRPAGVGAPQSPRESKIKAKRTGFCCVPDFSGTCHMYQGASLHAVIVDCLLHTSATTTMDMLACYVAHTHTL